MNAGNRFGFVVTGYSGRDLSIMSLFRRVLETNNPFPHGFFWTGIKGSPVRPTVEDFLQQARAKGVNAQYVPIETFDALLLRLWRNIDAKPVKFDTQVRKLKSTSINIPLPAAGRANPILRLNALPILSMPDQCLQLGFSCTKDWDDICRSRITARGNLILAKAEAVLCWGARDLITGVFGDDLASVDDRALPTDLSSPQNLGSIESNRCSRSPCLKAEACGRSRLLHSPSEVLNPPLLAPSVIQAEIDTLRDWVTAIRQRRDKIDEIYTHQKRPITQNPLPGLH